MKTYKPEYDDFVFSNEKPDVGYLYKEYMRSIQNGGNTANVAKNDDIRLARWAGQTSDGKKHSENRPEGESAFPFEGASDVRNRLVDRTINDIVAMMMTTFDRCQIKVIGTEFSDSEEAAVASTLTSWFLQRFRPDIRREAQLLAQYTLQYGWSGINVIWEQEMSIRHQTIRMDELNQMIAQVSQQNPNSSIKDLPAAIMNPEQEEYATSLIMMYLPAV
jgi:hypothetical protein